LQSHATLNDTREIETKLVALAAGIARDIPVTYTPKKPLGHRPLKR
jgi:hypothetical protein